MRFLRPGSLRLCVVSLVLLTGFLVTSLPALAEHDLTCHPPTGPGSGSHEVEMTVLAGEGPGGPGGLTMSTLKARFIGDGSGPPHVTGAFAMPNRGAGQAVTWTAIALAESGGNTDARAECADGDGDSLIGLQWLTVHFRDNQTRDLKLVTFAPDSEIDSSGTYMMHVRGLSDEELSFEVTVRLKGSFGEVDVVE